MKLKQLIIFGLLFLIQPLSAHAQADLELQEEYFRGVVSAIQESPGDQEGANEVKQNVTVSIENAETIPQALEIQRSIYPDYPSDYLPLQVGDRVVVLQTTLDGEIMHEVYDIYRMNEMVFFFAIFVLLVYLVAKKKGLYALVGLGISFLILIGFLVPRLLAGGSPVLWSFLSAIMIAITTFYLAHGFKKRTHLALSSTLLTLVIAFLLSYMAISGLSLFGLGSEDALTLTLGSFGDLDLRGLLLGAIVIGTLGILDDITVTQIATVHQIHLADKKLSFSELYKRGLSVGRDHIASIINTLVLAYAGASFPVLLILVHSPRPFWVSLNTEFLAEEVVRTLVGSMTLIVAVPIATLLAAYIYASKKEGVKA